MTAFQLGETEVVEEDADNRAVLSWQNGCYHVKGFINGRQFVDSFRTARDARREMATIKRIFEGN